jgi:PiT family inorganic phosphate transporter
MHADVLLVLITILVALIFDFVNGFHDSANSIATVVSTRVLSPRWAVVWAASFNVLAAFFLGTAVAKTIGTGMIRLGFVDQHVVLAGLFGAIVCGLADVVVGAAHPSSHALIGGYAGRRCRWQLCDTDLRPCPMSLFRTGGPRLCFSSSSRP